ncbi:hypothetical protein SOVF_074000 [Spinacia oleracea]|uniref:Uncharacterized protein isoform X2 n=1 Tax=Spinacia oleracea TaxID=3562 RepID=A0A9R0JIB0_SPIOL|nr:uncharacterized protein LOC110775721 isoform X2 [Spinacia oleracea]KNA18060.1 hypothetical protein SOVF_074000 [Spinacia oleracea]
MLFKEEKIRMCNWTSMVVLNFWYHGKFIFHPKRGYEQGLSETIISSRNRLSLTHMHKLIEKLGCKKEYTIWYVEDMKRFHEDGIAIKDPDDFYNLVELTKSNLVIHIVVQHRDVEEEEGKGLQNERWRLTQQRLPKNLG